MGKTTCEGANKIAISKVKKILSGDMVHAEDIVLTPMMHLQTIDWKSQCFNGMVVGVICNGTAKITIDGNSFEMHGNSLILLSDSSTVSNFKCSKACMGYFILYPHSFVNAAKLTTSDLLTISIMFGKSPCLQVCNDDITRLHSIASTLSHANATSNNQYDQKVQSSLFNAFFYTLASIVSKYASARLDNQERLSRADDIMRRFTALINASCEQERSVEFYANKLGITPKYLSLVCKKSTGHNASKIIDRAVIRRAKALLQQHGLSILEVSQQLNFVSQSFFGKYFKQRTGISPSRYKAQH